MKSGQFYNLKEEAYMSIEKYGLMKSGAIIEETVLFCSVDLKTMVLLGKSFPIR